MADAWGFHFLPYSRFRNRFPSVAGIEKFSFSLSTVKTSATSLNQQKPAKKRTQQEKVWFIARSSANPSYTHDVPHARARIRIGKSFFQKLCISIPRELRNNIVGTFPCYCFYFFVWSFCSCKILSISKLNPAPHVQQAKLFPPGLTRSLRSQMCKSTQRGITKSKTLQQAKTQSRSEKPLSAYLPPPTSLPPYTTTQSTADGFAQILRKIFGNVWVHFTLFSGELLSFCFG